MSELEEDFRLALEAFQTQTPNWQQTWADALRRLAKTFHKPAWDGERGSSNNDINEALRKLANLFEDHSNGISNSLANVQKSVGRPKSDKNTRSKQAFVAAVVLLELKRGRMMGRTRLDSLASATLRINRALSKRNLKRMTRTEIESAWRNRGRLDKGGASLLEMLGRANSVTEPMLEGMASGVALNTFSKTPLF